MAAAPRVLFVSKPVAPPWNDGSKNLVRDIAANLTRARPTVLTTPGAPPVGARVATDPIYRSGGGFAPALTANARVLARLVTGDAHDVWHFVFAPNAASSGAARVAIALRRAAGWRGRTVQTVASAPRTFGDAPRLLFGDRVVVLSEWMRARLVGAGASAGEIEVIPPCATAPDAPSPRARAEARARYAKGAGTLVVYPGDYEVSTGALTVARAIGAVAAAVPDVAFVFACRPKTKDAGAARLEVVDATEPVAAGRVTHVGEIPDLHALLAAADAVAFPVDDLYGKVDVPLVVLEAMALGVPLVLARGGPLETVNAARFVDGAEPASLARELVDLLSHPETARSLGARGREEYAARFSPEVVSAAYDDLYERL